MYVSGAVRFTYSALQAQLTVHDRPMSIAIRGSGAGWGCLGAHVTQHGAHAARMTPPTRRVRASPQAPRGAEPVCTVAALQTGTCGKVQWRSLLGQHEPVGMVTSKPAGVWHTVSSSSATPWRGLESQGDEGNRSSGRGTSRLGKNSGSPAVR